MSPPGPPRAAPLAPERDESFIPWEMIEPLLEEGMLVAELRTRLLARIGLDPERYTLILREARWTPIQEALKRGLYIETIESVNRRGCVKRGSELVR